MQNLLLSNTLSKKKEIFVPIDKNNIRMYVCGPTVYDFPHIGNARPLIVFDILFRVLKTIYGKDNVTYVRNITDIDDKIIKASNEKNIDFKKLTDEFTFSFNEDCKYLGCLKPTFEPKATDHIEEMIEMINSLLNKNYAYEKAGHVFFDINKFSSYGALSKKTIKDLDAGSRVEISKIKKNPGDFVLWKPSKNNEPGWDSKFGKGRPGWHIECSAMSKKYLSSNFDIHGGGLDLIFPHHENEIAQSFCANDKLLAKFWIHNGYVTVNKKKMAKSENNFVTINELKKKYNGQIIRLAMLSTHYTQPFDWNEKILKDAKIILDKWYEFYIDENIHISESNKMFLLDDLNIPKMIANIHSLYKKAKDGEEDAAEQLTASCKFLGLFNENKETWFKFNKKTSIKEEEINKLINERNFARKNKDFKKSDEIRDYLLKNNILLEDTENKTTWKFKK